MYIKSTFFEADSVLSSINSLQQHANYCFDAFRRNSTDYVKQIIRSQRKSFSSKQTSPFHLATERPEIVVFGNGAVVEACELATTQNAVPLCGKRAFAGGKNARFFGRRKKGAAKHAQCHFKI